MRNIMEKNIISPVEPAVNLERTGNSHVLSGTGKGNGRERDITAALNMLGPVVGSGNDYELTLNGRKISISLTNEEKGIWKIRDGNGEMREEYIKIVSKQIVRSELCANCGVCAASCPTGAITMNGIPSVDTDKCIRCGLCFDSCVIHHYFNRIVKLPNSF